MLALKIPINNIIDKVREHFSDRESRDNLDDLKYYNLIDKKKIHSLKTRLKDPSIIQDSNDALSTSLKVEALRQESFNQVLLYKQQGIEDPSKRLANEDFIYFSHHDQTTAGHVSKICRSDFMHGFHT